MGHFSNGTEGEMYQERYCDQCAHWSDDVGCPVWFLHELHVGDKGWAATLNKLIPLERKTLDGIRHEFNGQCYTFRKREGPRETPLTPGQRKGLEEWRRAKSANPERPARRPIERIDL